MHAHSHAHANTDTHGPTASPEEVAALKSFSEWCSRHSLASLESRTDQANANVRNALDNISKSFQRASECEGEGDDDDEFVFNSLDTCVAECHDAIAAERSRGDGATQLQARFALRFILFESKF